MFTPKINLRKLALLKDILSFIDKYVKEIKDKEKVENNENINNNINIENNINNRSMKIRITDEELIEKTGGIIQGMSGSPIVQGEYIIGAVTHVVVDNPHKGYGIFLRQSA